MSDIKRLQMDISHLRNQLQPLLQTAPIISHLPILDNTKLLALTDYVINALLYCEPD